MDFQFSWRTGTMSGRDETGERRPRLGGIAKSAGALMPIECACGQAGRRTSAVKAAVVLAAVLVAGIALGPAASPAAAAEPHWPSGTYKYIAVDQPVADALTEFGRNIGIPVRVSKAVKGRLSAGMPVGSAEQFLEWVCNRYGLVWHFDGVAINVATEAEVQTEVLKLDANTASTAMERLETLGVADLRFPVKVSDKDDLVSVSGPPSYIALVKRTLGVPARAADTGDKVVPVRVFRGKQAEAQEVPAGKTK